ncbi:MAG TPA: RsmE family RNA methyltransferase [Candidatus Dormibacteraeota bacterium]|nr:RsmE family RNA methyltransferase [Candidatus Dormibacteraeota bacterium]
MIRVFLDSPPAPGEPLVLTGETARHLGGALRLRPGEEFVAVAPGGVEHRCRATEATPARVTAEVGAGVRSAREPGVDVRICQALLKGDQLERILEFATELGAAAFQPLLTERVVARPEPAKLAARLPRWRQIVRGAAELGQRGRLPEVLQPATLPDALAPARQRLLLYEGTGLKSLSDVPLGATGISLLVGPEGGWSDAEVELATAAGALPVTLGPRIMRPLPAVMTALAVVLHRAGDLRLKETR